ncbi:PAS domain-containing sensor histidine kinase [Maribellus maritimus]|uniref:PAS domain-containing sensor histidine kinase n=1 Tax=Maribellus maritimus TaxID=2870838 RepID=UPI001EEA2A7C|nr:ATP-binding protein [Maribellus maritimus]MCG6190592.1 PAS domain S-box protein [Maribellus maritimus]
MENSEKYKRLIESLENEYFFYSHNLEGKYLYISPSVEKVLGYSVEEAYGGIVKHMTNSERNKKTIETLKKSAGGEKQKTFELELLTKNKQVKIIEITESPLCNNKGEIESIEGVAHDVTERSNQEEIIKKQNINLQKQEEELRQNLNELTKINEYNESLKKEIEKREQLLLNIINEIPEKIFLKDKNGRFIIANTPVAKNYGLTPTELIGKTDFDFYPQKEAEKKHKREKEIINSGKGVSYEEGDFNKEDGLIVNTRIKPFKIDYLNITGVLGVQVDITQIRKKETELKKLNRELKTHQDELKENLKEITATKEELERTLEDLKETQSQLVQSEKMGALGNLIAGIAHEINTPIGAINASVSNISNSLDNSMQNLYKLFTKLTKKELLIFLRIMGLMEKSKPALTSKQKRQYKKEIRNKLDKANIENPHTVTDILIYLNLYEEVDKIIPLLDVEDPEFILKSIKDIYSVRKNAENIKLAVDKASKVVFALKRFVHKDYSDKKEKADLIENIETVLTLQHNQLKQGIKVVKEFDDIPFVNCYPDELVQVWINFISNAIHAMENHGTLTISVKNLKTHVQVSIKDTGKGIPEEIREKIFEPFFTTKKSGEGTGIGLDIVQRIVEKHNAELNLESEVGKGAAFIVTLPVD